MRHPFAFLAVLLTLLLLAPTALAQEATPTNGEANKAIARQLIDEAIGQGNLALIDELFGPDPLVHGPAYAQPLTSAEEIKAHVEEIHTAFPDLVHEITAQLAEGEKVVTYFVVTGTHEGPFLGIPPSGNRIEVPGISIETIRAGKIVESWGIADALLLLQQVGAIPATPASATPTSPPPPIEPAGTSDPAANAELVRQLYAAFSAGDAATMEGLLAEDFVDRTPGPSGPTREGFLQDAAAANAAFGLTATVEETVAEGDFVAVRLTLSGVHQGEYLGIPATGNPVTIDAVTTWRVQDGQLAEVRAMTNTLALITQLSAPPATPQATPAT